MIGSNVFDNVSRTTAGQDWVKSYDFNSQTEFGHCLQNVVIIVTSILN